jgi:Rieske Fe-S protein
MLGSSHDEPDYDHDGFADGVLMDRCHQGTWDPYHRGAPVAGPAPTRLAALHVEPRQGILYGDGFDGPTGATHDVRF